MWGVHLFSTKAISELIGLQTHYIPTVKKQEKKLLKFCKSLNWEIVTKQSDTD